MKNCRLLTILITNLYSVIIKAGLFNLIYTKRVLQNSGYIQDLYISA